MTAPNPAASPAAARFAAAVRKRRRDLNWTVERLARESGVTHGTVVNTELLRAGPSLGTAVLLAAGLKTTVGELLGEGTGQ